ncbi:MAG: DUF4935 domain-containing protein [Nanoarchaeota archaeon]|nr:DUF4935 domain-containing protein [Nanoarchaeota archaeon]MCB1144578.1 DUF4935 domain-containing protein [Leptospiraceae bacterium]
MKDTFFEYNRLHEEEIKNLWDRAIFIFDTNVLLNLYRYSDDTSKKFLETIVKLETRVWIPYQVGLEFNKNRLKVISEQKKHYEEFEKKIIDLIGEIENKNRSPFLPEELFEKLLIIKGDIIHEVDKRKRKYDESLLSDPLLNEINLIFKGKVGSRFNSEYLKQLFLEGEKRYKDKIPPGYADSQKPEPEKYGDLIIWKQIITKSKEENIDIIFILDDRKEDWWLDHHGKTISARPELLREFKSETKQRCHFYKPFQFLEYSNEYLGNSVQEEVIEEVKNYREEMFGFVGQNIDYQTNSKIDNEKNIITLELILEGSHFGLNKLMDDLQNVGYSVVQIVNSNVKLYKLLINLPNIPDLERRLESKFLSQLPKYQLSLQKITKWIGDDNS